MESQVPLKCGTGGSGWVHLAEPPFSSIECFCSLDWQVLAKSIEY